MTASPEELDKLNWLDRLNRVVDEEVAEGKPGFAVDYIVAALIRALHEKGILSRPEREALFAAWDRLDEASRQTSEKEMKALREQYPELEKSFLGTSDPP